MWAKNGTSKTPIDCFWSEGRRIIHPQKYLRQMIVAEQTLHRHGSRRGLCLSTSVTRSTSVIRAPELGGN